MLKGIPSILTPELLKVLMEMGHGDEITIGDGNYPAASTARNLIRLDGHGVCEILDAILTFFPLDTYVDEPVLLMEKTPGDPADTSIAIGVAKGNTQLLDAINGALAELEADGTLQSIVDKYITAE